MVKELVLVERDWHHRVEVLEKVALWCPWLQ